ncbi:hypothetical protein [Roseivivax sediminis]|uniref:Uncharacterized protein n=1 Tax=Roseivivax sediminis TaxID=936889 RepID=A0A1I1XRL5_9RHOB|nr:hypothetical protein [Roseivivax sediminis]SFE08423.1 hypothetical protein SAMN04515678_10657 [Roseivivax sediminis]
MGRILKWLFYLVLLGAVLLVVYAYVAEPLGLDSFAPAPEEVRQPVDLDVD